MTEKLSFETVKNTHIERLEQYTPIVLRVHGDHHPEMEDVNRIFNQIKEKLNNEQQNPSLEEDFIELREVTDNYTIPADVCESYEAVYNMLAELDQAYSVQ